MSYNTQLSDLLEVLNLVKFYHDIGIFEAVCRNMEDVVESDFFELMLLGAEKVAPIYDCFLAYWDDNGQMAILGDSANDDVYRHDVHYHYIYTFSSPEMQEYYRLCRLYEYKHSVEPKDNPYVRWADVYYTDWCYSLIHSVTFIGFDDDRYSTKLWAEICPESGYLSIELFECIHIMLTYYASHLNDLRRELMQGPMTFLPELPAPKDGEDHAPPEAA